MGLQLEREMEEMREEHEAEMEDAHRQLEELAAEADAEVERLHAHIQVRARGGMRMCMERLPETDPSTLVWSSGSLGMVLQGKHISLCASSALLWR